MGFQEAEEVKGEAIDGGGKEEVGRSEECGAEGEELRGIFLYHFRFLCFCGCGAELWLGGGEELVLGIYCDNMIHKILAIICNIGFTHIPSNNREQL